MIRFFYDSGSGTVLNYGSGSAERKSYGSYGSDSATLLYRHLKGRRDFRLEVFYMDQFPPSP
jgi:hypothetical protein